MIADEYFRVRADLGTALFFLQTLAHEAHATREDVQVLQDASASLREPFLFVAIGAEKAGKSSLFNALFGRELCLIDEPEKSDVVQLLKYGSREKEVPLSEGVLACYRPIFLLRDFTLADAPGGSIHEEGEHALNEQFLPRADLILFVVSVVDPWNARAWERLQSLNPPALRNVAIIVQQADLRNPVELDAVVEHLKQFALEKLAVRVPVFPISAKMGYLAKTSGVDKARLFAESGLDRLEKFIDERVARGPERWGTLRSVWQKGDAILRNLATAARGEFSSIEESEQVLSGTEGALQNEKQQSLRQVNGELWSLSQLYERAEKRGEEALERDLSFRGLLRLLFAGGRMREEAPSGSAEDLVAAVEGQIETFAAALKTGIGGHWTRFHETLPAHLIAQDRQRAATELLAADRAPMSEAVAATIREQFSGAQFQADIHASFRGLMRSLRISAVGLVVLILAIVFASGTAAVLIGVAAAVAAVWGIAVVLLKRREILRQFVTAMVIRREALLAPVEDYFRTNIEEAYAKLSESFAPMRTHLAEQRSIQDPIMARVTELQTTFGKCAAELGFSPRG